MKKHLIALIGILVAVVLAAGMAAAGSTRSAQVAGLPLFALCGLLAFGVQWLLFVPAYLLQTERFYDLAGWQYLTLVSPLFVYLLLTRVSGINMLEARDGKRWGDDPAYREYCRRTPVLVPRPWS